MGGWLTEGLGELGDWTGLSDLWQQGKDFYNAPYQKKQEGLQQIQSMIPGMKRERMQRKDATYNKANAAYDDSRKAMAALYGDPSTWSK